MCARRLLEQQRVQAASRSDSHRMVRSPQRTTEVGHMTALRCECDTCTCACLGPEPELAVEVDELEGGAKSLVLPWRESGAGMVDSSAAAGEVPAVPEPAALAEDAFCCFFSVTMLITRSLSTFARCSFSRR